MNTKLKQEKSKAFRPLRHFKERKRKPAHRARRLGGARRQAGQRRLTYHNPVQADGRVKIGRVDRLESEFEGIKLKARSPGRPEAPWLHSASTGARLASGISPWGQAPLSPVPCKEIPERPRLNGSPLGQAGPVGPRYPLGPGTGGVCKWMRNIPNLGTVNLTDPQIGDEPHGPPPCNHPRPAGTSLKATRHAQRRTRY